MALERPIHLLSFGVGMGREAYAHAFVQHAKRLDQNATVITHDMLDYLNPLERLILKAGYTMLSPFPPVYRFIRGEIQTGRGPRTIRQARLHRDWKDIPLAIAVSPMAKRVLEEGKHVKTKILTTAGDRIVHADEVGGRLFYEYIAPSKYQLRRKRLAEAVVYHTHGFMQPPELTSVNWSKKRERLQLGKRPHVVAVSNGSGLFDTKRVINEVTPQVKNGEFTMTIFTGHFRKATNEIRHAADRQNIEVQTVSEMVTEGRRGVIYLYETPNRTASIAERGRVVAGADALFVRTANEFTHSGLPILVDQRQNRNAAEQANTQVGEFLGFAHPIRGSLGEELHDLFTSIGGDDTKAQGMLDAGLKHNDPYAGERIVLYAYERQEQLLEQVGI